jgi:small-conductance mechanosensitive channel
MAVPVVHAAVPASAPLVQVVPGAARWSALLHSLGERLTPLFGTWPQEDFLPFVSGLQLILSLLILCLTGAVILFAHRYAHRAIARAREASAAAPGPAPATSLLHLGLAQARLPILAFLTVWGFYSALCVAVFRVEPYGPGMLAALDWAKTTALVLILFWFLFRLIRVLEREFSGWGTRTVRKWDYVLLAVGIRALRLILPLIAVLIVVPTLDLPEHWHAVLQQGVSILLIAFVGVVFCELANTAEKAIQTEYRVDVQDNLATRKIQTQVNILRKIAVALIILVTLACELTVFEPVRALGRSILASAGVAGIVIGFAAQKSLGTLLAGIQIAFSQPIRLDDVVIVEGEWGRIEEITLTYVVVAIWDLRRMVLPITYFLEKPFQNWTRTQAALLGTVFLYLDYNAPIAELRKELDRILAASPLWDKKVKGLQVTDAAKDRTIEIRILASAVDSGKSFDLRCEIREKMISFLQREHPDCLPRDRSVVEITRLTREEEAGRADVAPSSGQGAHVLTGSQAHGDMASPVTVNQDGKTAEPKPPVAPPA